MAIFLKHRNKYGCSSDDMNELIALTRSVASPGSRIPQSIGEMEKLTRDLVVEHQEHFICKCEQFRFGTEVSCTFCGGHKEKPTKYYTIPIGPRLQQLKEISSLAKVLSISYTQPSRYVDDIHASPAWKAFTDEVGREAIALSYCSDGFNPFHHNITAGSYSIWAQSGLVLNLPPQLRTKKSTTMLFGLIAGPSAPKRLNIYNEIIIDELVQLDQGIKIYDASTKKASMLRARILYTVCDVPGNAKEQNRVVQNAKSSCGHCHLKGVHSKILDKTVYPGGRTFLSKDHQMRYDASFPTRSIEEAIVTERTRSDEIAMSIFCDKLEHQTRDTGINNNSRFQAIAQEYGRYGSSQWLRLPYLDMQNQHAPVEPMHAIKVVAEHVTKLLNGDEDGSKIRAQERAMDRFVTSCPNEVFQIYVKEKKTFGQKRKRQNDIPNAGQTDEVTTTTEPCSADAERSYPKKKLPPAPFTLTSDEKKTADTRLKSMRFPQHFDVPDTLFTNICGGIKTHTWLQLYTTGALRYCLRGMLGQQQRRSLNSFLLGLETLYRSPTDLGSIDNIEESWHVTLCSMERDFPLSLQSYVMHLLHQISKYVKLYGPPSNFWMFPYERFNKTLSECITNARNPELSAVKKMEVHWLVTMLEFAGYLEPLHSRPETGCKGLQFLQPGAHRPSPQLVNQLERDALTELFNSPLTNQYITVYRFARRCFGQTEMRYRDTSTERQNQRGRSSVVSCHLPQGQFVGEIKYFFLYSTEEHSHELAFVDWIVQPEQCTDSHCFKVHQNRGTTSPVMFVSQLSAPLIHAWDKDTLWLPHL